MFNQAGKIYLLHVRHVNSYEDRQRSLSEAILEQISLGLISWFCFNTPLLPSRSRKHLELVMVGLCVCAYILGKANL